jgi:predicted transcriptional regulator
MNVMGERRNVCAGAGSLYSIVESYLEYTPHMETIQIVLEAELLKATDKAARRTKRNRSALVREALRGHLRRLEVQAMEERDRQGYARRTHAADESLLWEAEAAWPDE